MLRTSDLSEVLKVGQTASGCDDVDQLRGEVLHVLSDVFHVERASFYLTRPSTLPRLDLDNVVTCGVDAKYATLFREHYWKLDPIFKAINLRKTVVPFKDLVSREDLLEGEWYHGFLKPQSVRDLIGINLRAGNRLLGVLVLVRSESECFFSSREMVKAELIAPYLTVAIEKATFLDKARKTEKIISAMCRDLAYTGIVALDESFAQVYANEEARKALSQAIDGQESSENPFVTLPKSLHLQCQKLFQDPSNPAEPVKRRRVDLMLKGEKQSVPVNVSLFHDASNSRLCLIGIGRNEPTSMLPEQSKVLGLTRRESEIVGFVCQGLTNSEIGGKLFICEGTVENHLHSIYEKLGVRNRTCLVNFVTSLQYSR